MAEASEMPVQDGLWGGVQGSDGTVHVKKGTSLLGQAVQPPPSSQSIVQGTESKIKAKLALLPLKSAVTLGMLLGFWAPAL